jgi:uncharacterized protein with HEPN domain
VTSRVAGWIADILHNAHRARDFVGALAPDELARDEVRLYGTLHALTLIGEAAKRIPPDMRARFPDVPWKAMAGLRDIIVHQYDELDIAAIHRTATEDARRLIDRLPAVIAAIERPRGR